jgi:hypothetical protein
VNWLRSMGKLRMRSSSTGTIDCDPEECQIVMHKGQAFVFNGTDDEVATYVLTAVAEFTEAKD